MSAPDTNSALFYRSLVHAINSATGDLFLNLNEGQWQTSFSGKTFTWIIPRDSIVEIRFDYRGGVLKKAAAMFTPPVQLVLPDNEGTITVETITWNQLGDVSGIAFSSAPGNIPDAAVAKAKKVLAMRREPHQLFLGVPLVGFAAVTASNSGGGSPATFSSVVERVRFEKTEFEPGLNLTFRDHALIKFSDSGLPGSLYNNFITLGAGGEATFDEIDYSVNERTLRGTLTTFIVAVEDGVFSTSDLLIQLKSGSKLKFNNLEFERSATGDVLVDGSFGTLSAITGFGSKLTLAGTGSGPQRSDYLEFDDGSKVDIVGFRLTIQSSSSRVEASGGSHLNVRVRDGRFVVAQNGFIAFGPGRISSSFQGVWDSRQSVSGRLDVEALTITGVAGEIEFTPDTRLQFTDGTIDSTSLSFQTGQQLAGTFDRFSLNIAENSHAGFGRGIQMIAAAGGSFVGARPGTPLELSRNKPFPVGTFTLVLPFKRLFNAKSPALAAQNGLAHLTLVSAGDGSVSGQNCDFTGSTRVVTGNLTVILSVSIDQVSFTLAASGEFHMTGYAALKIAADSAITIVTPFVKGIPDHDDFRAFPLTLIASLPQDLVIPRTAFTIDDGVVNLPKLTVTPVFKVSIPKGLGEHEKADDENSANGQHGPDEDKNRQEAVQDKISALTVHIYLVAATYDFTSSLNIGITNNTLDIELTNFRIAQNEAVAFDRDGGNLGIIGTLVGFIAGDILAGPFGSTVGAVIGNMAGNTLDDRINDLVAAAIARKLIEQRFSWHTEV